MVSKSLGGKWQVYSSGEKYIGEARVPFPFWFDVSNAFKGINSIKIEKKGIEVPNKANSFLVFYGVDTPENKIYVEINGKKEELEVEKWTKPLALKLKGNGNLLDISISFRLESGYRGIWRPIFLNVPEGGEDPIKPYYYYLEKEKFADIPSWLHNHSIVYEVFLRNFSEEGIRGVMKRLDELKRLGVGIIWFMPIHPIGEKLRKGTYGSPYSVKDYFEIEPSYGTKEDFKEFVEVAHEKGFKVIIDLVANHTAWDNPFFEKYKEKAYRIPEDINAREHDWYDIVELDYSSPITREFMKEVIKYWVREFDIDGYRCDVACFVPYDFWDEAIRELREIKSDIFMLGECEDPNLGLVGFHSFYDWTTSVTSMHILKERNLPTTDLQHLLISQEWIFPYSYRFLFLENHDLPRAFRVYGRPFVFPATLFIYTQKGLPLIYNGFEYAISKDVPLFEKQIINWEEGDREFFEYLRILGEIRNSEDFWNVPENEAEYLNTKNNIALVYRKKQYISVVNLTPFEDAVDIGGSVEVVLGNVRVSGALVNIPPFGYALLKIK